MSGPLWRRTDELYSFANSMERMKTRTIILLAASLAVAVTFGQWAWVKCGEGVPLGPEQHKVFTYGFPFMIVDCPSSLSIRTPTWQVPLRFLANLAVTFVIFLSGPAIGRFARRLFVKPRVS